MSQSGLSDAGATSGPLIALRDGAVQRLVLANPPANVLSLDLMAALRALLDQAEADPRVRVVVISAGGRVFSAGHDLKEMTAHRNDPDRGEAFFEKTFAACADLMQSVVKLEKPVIAEVEGIATAAGCQLVASCDLAVASQSARFGVNGIDVGLFCSTPAVALGRTVHPRQALELLLTGELIDAQTARDIGLVNRVAPNDLLRQTVTEIATRIAEKPPQVIALGKRGFRAQATMDLGAAYAHASKVMVANMLRDEAEEGIAAFIGKREPNWRKR